MNNIIMVDFDGTITKEDTCVSSLKEFATRDWKHIDEKWVAGELSTRQCSIELYKLMDFDEERLKSFLEDIEIDDYFVQFAQLCEEKGIDIYIVSDGFDYNIKTVLAKYGLDYLKQYSNGFRFDEGGNYSLTFPHENKDCGKCGTCKSNIFYNLKSKTDKIIYIGDGYSDRCVASKVDILFAKSYLAEYCDNEGIEYIEYESFKDIIDYLKEFRERQESK
ncbi:MAG: 2-hydroxy-3-keto-5-methylthiopentenyl-phosphate phosphatase [Candidatus Petromonas sp.]|jgi:2,3-diketo-5-methylthio-1-phosphopentane phosphatase|nr:2-hydroxy-3-keto-5-methylthiopentenyl-phosphate phosphatase [Candidatus Petromonas sp.]